MCSNRRFPSHGFADRFRCHTHRGAVSSSTRSRDQRRDAASLSEEEEEGEGLPERLCGTLATLSPPPLLLFLCQEQPPTNVGVECSVYLRGRESGMGHSWRAPAKLCRTSRRKLTVCPCQVFFSSLSSHVRIAICCFHWVVLFFLPPPPFSLSPLSVALVLKTQSLIVHSFSSTNFYTCSSRNTTLLVFPMALTLDEGDSVDACV